MIQPSAPIAQNEQTTRATPGRGSGSSACILKPVSWLNKTLPLPLPTENEVEISRTPFDIDIQEQNGQTNLRRVTEDSSIRQMIKHC